MLFYSVNSLHVNITKAIVMLDSNRITPVLQVNLLRLITQTSNLLLILIILSFTIKLLFFFLLPVAYFCQVATLPPPNCVCVCVGTAFIYL